MNNDQKQKALESAIENIEKQYGKGAIMKLGESSMNSQIETVPTGSLSLDIALGVGGVPRGRIMGRNPAVRQLWHFTWWLKCRSRAGLPDLLMRSTP